MSNGLKPHSKYKGTGEPWLGDIPAHWDTAKLKHILAERNERGFPAEPLLAATQTKGVVLKSDYGTRTVEAMKDLHLLKLVRIGDFVISLRSFQGGIEFARTQGIISPAYTILYPRDSAVHGYLAALFKSRPFIGNLSLYVTGIRQGQNIDYVKLGRSSIPLPPPAEQASIVRFLGAVDRKVNRFIRAKRRLIEVLTEQKQAIITRAVTKGSNPNVRLKPSGIDWLGDVPEHWEMWQIGHFADVGNGSTPSRGNMAYWTGGTFPWLNSSTVNARTISTSDQFVTDTALRECHLPRVPAGSVLVAITGQGKTRGMAAVLTIEATINQHLAFIRPRATGMTATPEYLRLFLHAAYPELRRMSDDSGSTKGALTCEDLRHFRVALMPRAEQEAVVSAVAEQTHDVDAVIERTEREIDLIREYRTRLVADVVTGKVDVRAVAAMIPDEGNDGAIVAVDDEDTEMEPQSEDASDQAVEEVGA